MRPTWLLLLLVACGPRTPPRATAVDAQRANVALEELEQGRKLLVTKCVGCHATPLPREHETSAWPHIVADMAPLAKLDAAQTALIERYLVVMSERPK